MIKAKKSREIDMLNGPLLGKILLFALPLILTSLLQLLYNAADIIVVGQFDGKAAVAAVGSTTSVIHLVTNAAIGIATGATMCIATQLGAGEKNNVLELSHTALLSSAVIGVGLGALCFCFAKTILTWMNTDPAVIEMSAAYLRVYFLGMPVLLLYNVASAVIRTGGDTRRPLLYLAVSGFANIILNLILVAVFHMGVIGVAIATVSAEALSAFLSIRHLLRMPKENPCKLYFRRLAFYKGRLSAILRAALPVAAHSMMFNLANVVLQAKVNVFGIDAVSGSSAAESIEGFTYVAMNAFAQTAIIFVGQNSGACKYDRVKKAVILNAALGASVGLLFGGLSYLFAHPILSVYLGTEEAAIAFGITRLTVVILSYFLCGIMDSVVGGSQGLGSSFAPMLIAVFFICGCRFLWFYTAYPALFRLFDGQAHLQMQMLFLSYPVSWILTLVAQTVYFLWLYRRRKQAVSPRAMPDTALASCQ